MATRDLTFLDIIQLYEAQAMIAMGKYSDPMTGQIHRNLDMAQANINIVEVLQEKTQGNLSGEEEAYLRDALQNLRLNFVEEKKKGDASPEKKPNLLEDDDDSNDSGLVTPPSGLVDADGRPL